MKKKLKMFLAAFLVVTMLIGLMPLSVFAQEPTKADMSNDLSIQATNSIGNVISNSLTEMSDENSTEYSISNVNIDGKAFYAELSNTDECNFVVAIYDENGQMLGSAVEKVASGACFAQGTISIDEMPKYYILKAFLLDDNYAPLCSEYYDIEHTKEFEKFDKKTTDDFGNDIIVNFDEDKKNNFAVLSDNSHEVLRYGTVNKLKSSDVENGKYVFSNINEEITSLNQGDILCYDIGSENMIVIKISSIVIDGSTATVTADLSSEIDDLFKFVKVNSKSNQNGDDKTINMKDADEGIKLVGFEPYETDASTVKTAGTSGTAAQSIDQDISSSVSCPVWEMNNSATGIKFKLTASLGYNIKLFYDADWEFRWDFWNSLDMDFFVQVTVSAKMKGSVSLSKDLKREFYISTIDFVTPVGIVCSVGVRLVVSVSGKIELTIAELSYTIGVRYSDEKGFKNLCSGPKADFSPSANSSVEAAVAVRLSPSISLIKVMGFSINGEVGVKANVTLFDSEKNNGKKHLCDNPCFDGKSSLYISASLTGDIFGKAFKEKQISEALEINAKDFHIRLDGGLPSINSGKCLNYAYRVDFLVKNSGGTLLSGAKITSGANNDVLKANNNNLVTETNSSGEASFYYKTGTYTAQCSHDGNTTASKTVKVEYDKRSGEVTVNGKTDKIVFELQPDGTVRTIVDSGRACAGSTCGDHLRYTFYSDGELVISGTGDMHDSWVIDGYSQSWCYSFDGGYFPPWATGNMYDIKSIVVEEGVSSVGNYAFAMYTNLEKVELPNSLLSIGEYAFSCQDSFYNSSKLETIKIPENVKIIGSGAFSYCKRLTKIEVDSENKYYTVSNGVLFSKDMKTLVQYPAGLTAKKYSVPNDVTAIFSGAFSGCKNLEEIVLPNGLTTIGKRCFEFCWPLKINIPNTVNEIGESAFARCGIESISIPNNISKINDYTFYHCNLNKVNLPNSIRIIGEGAFQECERLENIKIPDGVETIERSAFNGSGLVSVTIPKTVTSIGYFAFCNCYNLSDVFFEGNASQWNSITISGENECLLNATIHYNSSGLSTSSTQSLSSPQAVRSAPDEIMTVTADCNYCVPGGSYIILSASGYSKPFELKSDSLYYINEVQADESGSVNISFLPKRDEKTAFILIAGNFGNGYSELRVLQYPESPVFTSASVSMNYKSKSSLPSVHPNVIYQSSDPSVVSVDESGNITAKKVGTAVITATIVGTEITDSCKVTVSYAWWQWIIRILLLGFLWY